MGCDNRVSGDRGGLRRAGAEPLAARRRLHAVALTTHVSAHAYGGIVSSPNLPDPVQPIGGPTSTTPDPGYPPPERTFDTGDSWFRRMPNGGTVFTRSPKSTPHPAAIPVEFFVRAPTGGGTVNRTGDDDERDDALTT